MMAPAGTPQSIVDKLNREIVEILKTPAMRESLLAQGAQAAYGTPDELAAFIASEARKWNKIIETAGIRPD